MPYVDSLRMMLIVRPDRAVPLIRFVPKILSISQLLITHRHPGILLVMAVILYTGHVERIGSVVLVLEVKP